MRHYAIMSQKANSLKSPGLASTRSGTKLPHCLLSPKRTWDSEESESFALFQSLDSVWNRRENSREGLGPSAPVNTNTFTTFFAASIRPSKDRFVASAAPRKGMDDRQISAVTASHPTLSLPKPQAPYVEDPVRALAMSGSEANRGKDRKRIPSTRIRSLPFLQPRFDRTKSAAPSLLQHPAWSAAESGSLPYLVHRRPASRT